MSDQRKISISIDDLERLLRMQKESVIKKLNQHTYYWNADSIEGKLIPVNINLDKFKEQGMSAEYPQEFEVLKKYLTP